ncbi:DUF4350 domain-containing protein [Microbacterium koreense]|uniref:DUF4350 domain-containing protein n=1 Tax=Microbacterium koreense TaxID=323761 RepID=A0ABW2ZUD5_9MICO
MSVTAVGVGRRARRTGFWVAVGVVVLVVGGLGAAIGVAGQWQQRDALDPESSGPLGTRAIVEVLRTHGVEVVIARDRSSAREALTGDEATLVLPDAPALSDEALEHLIADADDVVLIEPRSRTLDLLFPGSAPATGFASGPIGPDCAVPDAERAGAVTPGAVYAAREATTGCYPVDDGWGLLVAEREGSRTSAVDGRALFVNEVLADEGNAALAVNLMGRHPRVVWYVPSLADSDLADTSPTLGDLTPAWVSPVIVILLAAGVAAAIQHGRRFGPLVAERLPVTVRASETTEGRGRLYARARDAVHAADQLRIGTLGRLRRVLALGAGASATETADAAAARTGFDRAAVRAVLIDDVPRGDDDLLTLRTRLREIEDAVTAAVRPERNP